ncbi:MAG: UDP-N-acetylenolpyruvoylglucosamine reductase, partial [Saprospiraceae bacterium]|nr:UDP-N-acetylenolpyruvoylglucosamine reductase [Saprospiraceae bacterium]
MENTNLKPYNTFGISANARDFHVVYSEEEFKTLLGQNPEDEIRLLGGGSNVLITEDQNVCIVKIAIPGIRIVEETEDSVVVEAGAGELWHSFVGWTLDHGFGGPENLSS